MNQQLLEKCFAASAEIAAQGSRAGDLRAMKAVISVVIEACAEVADGQCLDALDRQESRSKEGNIKQWYREMGCAEASNLIKLRIRALFAPEESNELL